MCVWGAVVQGCGGAGQRHTKAFRVEKFSKITSSDLKLKEKQVSRVFHKHTNLRDFLT